MRVLHVVTAFPRYEGDIITPWLIETLKRLKDQGIEIEVFTSSYQGLGDQALFGLPIHRFRYFFKRRENLTHDETTPDRMRKGLLYKLMAVTYVLCGYAAIGRLCRKQKYDIVHIHWPFPHAAFGPSARASGSKLISSFYGVELRWVKSKLPLFKSFVRWAVRSADAVTAISSHTANEIRELVDREVTIIPFGAALGVQGSGRREPQMHANARDLQSSIFNLQSSISQPPIPDPRSPIPTILFVGRLVERKGLRYLIEAVKLVRAKLDAKLVIVGDGSERANLEAHVKALGLQDAVTFTGMISSPAKDEYLRRSSVFVLPAVTDSKGDTEGLGTVLLEAMMYHKPVIASNTGGITDIVKHEQTGLLVAEKDAAGLAAAIERVLTLPDLAARLAEQGFRHCIENFGWEKIVGDIVQLYEKVNR